MSEKIFIDGKNDFVEWFLISVVTESGTINEVCANAKKDEGHEISLKINGTECRVSDTLNRLKENYDEKVKKAAGELANEALTDFTLPIYNLLQNVEKAFRKKLLELGFISSEDDC